MSAQSSYVFNSMMTSHVAIIRINDDDSVEQLESFSCTIRLSGTDNDVMIFQDTAEVVIEDTDSK